MTLFLLLGRKSKNTSKEWNQIIESVKKYIFTKFITSAATGILTGIILQVSRAAGETAPIMFTGAVFFKVINEGDLFAYNILEQ